MSDVGWEDATFEIVVAICVAETARGAVVREEEVEERPVMVFVPSSGICEDLSPPRGRRNNPRIRDCPSPPQRAGGISLPPRRSQPPAFSPPPSPPPRQERGIRCKECGRSRSEAFFTGSQMKKGRRGARCVDCVAAMDGVMERIQDEMGSWSLSAGPPQPYPHPRTARARPPPPAPPPAQPTARRLSTATAGDSRPLLLPGAGSATTLRRCQPGLPTSHVSHSVC